MLDKTTSEMPNSTKKEDKAEQLVSLVESRVNSPPTAKPDFITRKTIVDAYDYVTECDDLITTTTIDEIEPIDYEDDNLDVTRRKEMQNVTKLSHTTEATSDVTQMHSTDVDEYITECETEPTIIRKLQTNAKQIVEKSAVLSNISTTIVVPELSTTTIEPLITECDDYDTENYDYDEEEESIHHITCCPDNLCLILYPNLELCLKKTCDNTCQREIIKSNLDIHIETLKNLVILYEAHKILNVLQSRNLHRFKLQLYERDILLEWKAIYATVKHLNDTNEISEILANVLTNKTLEIDDFLSLEQFKQISKFLSAINKNDNYSRSKIDFFIHKLVKTVIVREISDDKINSTTDASQNNIGYWTVLRKSLFELKNSKSFINRSSTAIKIENKLQKLLNYIGPKSSRQEEINMIKDILHDVQTKFEKDITEKIKEIKKIPDQSKTVDTGNFEFEDVKTTNKTNNKPLSLNVNSLGIRLHRQNETTAL